ncbi:MAG TPA: rhodanese-like domain-containing protein [Candidatus Limnocylindrales bacterium]|nr:rhodanese-like domain-containing protein [Candidatus Limnocylindrales bacterium]
MTRDAALDRSVELTITTDELRGRLDAGDATVVDVRPLPAYNGWRLEDEPRGGHVPGAVAFPIRWLDSVDAPEIVRILHEKQVVPGRTIVVYGSRAGDAERFAAHARASGLSDVRVYADGWHGWASDAALPVERLPRFQQLVHVGWLHDLLAGSPVEAAPSGRWLLFHVNFGVPEEYADGHLPGALYLDTNRLEDPADWNRRSSEELDHALRSLGITTDATVILYGRDTEGDANEKWPGRRAGQIAATRAAMILRYAGVDDVRILDGGYDAWVQAGGALETTPTSPTPVDRFGTAIPARPEVIVDLPEAKEILANPAGAALVSVRSWNEHIGRVSGYNYIGPAGRIKGDVWGNCGTDAYHMQHYRNVDNTMRPYPEIAANWADAGITPDKHVAFYCGTGWRASETWFYAWLMGWDRISVYDGGWFEWSADPANNPIEIGDPNEPAHAGAAQPAA